MKKIAIFATAILFISFAADVTACDRFVRQTVRMSVCAPAVMSFRSVQRFSQPVQRVQRSRSRQRNVSKSIVRQEVVESYTYSAPVVREFIRSY